MLRRRTAGAGVLYWLLGQEVVERGRHFQRGTHLIASSTKLIVQRTFGCELDIDVLPERTRSWSADVSRREAAASELNPYPNGLPDSVQHALARRYGEIFAVYAKHADKISRVTFWGVTDGESWLNNWPIRGRTSYPLLFDRAGNPKPAFEAKIQTVRKQTSVE